MKLAFGFSIYQDIQYLAASHHSPGDPVEPSLVMVVGTMGISIKMVELVTPPPSHHPPPSLHPPSMILFVNVFLTTSEYCFSPSLAPMELVVIAALIQDPQLIR